MPFPSCSSPPPCFSFLFQPCCYFCCSFLLDVMPLHRFFVPPFRDHSYLFPISFIPFVSSYLIIVSYASLPIFPSYLSSLFPFVPSLFLHLSCLFATFTYAHSLHSFPHLSFSSFFSHLHLLCLPFCFFPFQYLILVIFVLIFLEFSPLSHSAHHPLSTLSSYFIPTPFSLAFFVPPVVNLSLLSFFLSTHYC